MINNINDIKELINKFKKVYQYGLMDNVLDEEYSEEIKENKLRWVHKETISVDEHRWYTVEVNVYEFFKNDKSLGFLAVEEVGMLKSESMAYEDCFVSVEAYNVKEIVKKSYKIVRG